MIKYCLFSSVNLSFFIFNQYNEYDFNCMFIHWDREKWWLCFFMILTSFFTSANKKTKIIYTFFTISPKITLANEKKESKRWQKVLWKKNETILSKSTLHYYERLFLQLLFTAFHPHLVIWSYISDVNVHSTLSGYTCW